METKNKEGLFGAIKWICILLVVVIAAAFAYKTYKIVTKPAEIVGNAAEGVSEAVKTGSETVKNKTGAVLNRLEIEPVDQSGLNTISEAAFDRLVSMEETKPDGMKDRVFRRTNLPGHEGKVCVLSMDFGDGDLSIYVAADNKDFSKAKALGAIEDRLMRIVIRVEKDEIPFNVLWDNDQGRWLMKWKATTIKKPVGDNVAGQRVMDILKNIPSRC